jgi:hypothetical protein
MTGEQLHQSLLPLLGRRDVTTTDVLRAVVEAFNTEESASLDPADLADEDRSRLRDYIVRSEMFGPATLYHRVPRLDRLPLFEDAATKASWLHQRPCGMCPDGNEFPPEMFPVGLPPWSHQCAREVGPALRRAIEASGFYADHFRRSIARGPVCLRFVFVLGSDATMKDCDNMAKGLQDAFEGLLFVDDRQVEHLDLAKVHHLAGTPGYILVRRASTRLNDHTNVLVPNHGELAWLAGEGLDIESFLPTR